MDKLEANAGLVNLDQPKAIAGHKEVAQISLKVP